MKSEKKSKINKATVLITLEAAIFLLLVTVLFVPQTGIVLAGVGENNVTVTTTFTVGNSFPEIQSIIINDGNPIDLTPNTTTTVTVVANVIDYNGENDINGVYSEFFEIVESSYGASDDNNDHYTNNTCTTDTAYGDLNQANITCSFHVQYYAHNSTWNFTMLVNDTLNSTTYGSNTTTINTLLAFALPDTIDYGTINASFVSNERNLNVTNAGNVIVNLSLSGYGATVGDGWAMNCSLGNNISIQYEQYNLTASNNSAGTDLTLAQFDSVYMNLSSSPVVNEFDLNYRRNDTDQYVDDTNSTYWRIYVPLGSAGTCSGNIVFGAVQDAGI